MRQGQGGMKVGGSGRRGSGVPFAGGVVRAAKTVADPPLHVRKGKGAQLLDAANVDVVNVVLLPVLGQVVEDLARAEDDALERRGGAHGVTNGPRQPPTARGGKRREREKKIKEKKTAGKLGNDSRARCPCWQSPRWGRAKRAGSASPGPSRQGWTWRQNMPSSGRVSQRAAGSAPAPSPRRHQRRRRNVLALGVAQEALGCHDDQGLAELAADLRCGGSAATERSR